MITKEQTIGPIASVAGGAGYTIATFREHLSLGMQVGSTLLILGGLVLIYYQIRNARRVGKQPK